MLNQPWRRFLPDIELAPFATDRDVLADALPVLTIRRRIAVPDWAEQSRRVDVATYQGPWKNDFSPYMVEPSRQVTSRRYGAVVFVGPSRAGKSEPLILNTVGHAIDCKPRDTLVVCQTQDSAKQFSERKLAPMLRANPHLQDKLQTGRGADNIHEKKFAGGMNLQIRWPVIGYFSQNEYFTVLLTDRDRMPDDVDGEGDPFMLARKRVQHAGSLGMVVSESSPGRLVEQDDWTASTPHEAPPCNGILSEYNLGTRGQFYWECPHCSTLFRPHFDTLHWEKKATHGESARTVFMACPHGCVIGPDRKHTLNAEGVWLHEAGDGKGLVEIGDASVRDTDVVSYWCEGPVAAMQSWEQLVLRQLQGQASFDERGDETALKATVTLDQGRPYHPSVISLGDGLDEAMLKGLAKDYPLGVAPSQTRFLTVAIDVQTHRFVVHVDAWGPGLERWLIDRIEIVKPPEEAPGGEKRSIDPARYAEDWAVIPPLLETVYPVEGSEYGIKPAALVIDAAGAPGVTENAYRFQRAQRKAGNGRRVYLVRGQGGLERDRVRYGTPEKILQKKTAYRSDIKLIFAGTDKLKDEVTLQLTRKEAGSGAFHLSKYFDARVFAEFCAEIRTEKGWVRRKSGLANEALDLGVYGKALAIVLKGETLNWDNPPSWAANVTGNVFGVRMVAEKTAASTQPVVKAEPIIVARPGRRMLSRGI